MIVATPRVALAIEAGELSGETIFAEALLLAVYFHVMLMVFLPDRSLRISKMIGVFVLIIEMACHSSYIRVYLRRLQAGFGATNYTLVTFILLLYYYILKYTSTR